MSAPGPSLEKLREVDRRQRMEAFRPSIEGRARAYGIPFTERTDVFALARAVHAHEDELKRPALEARARSLGVPTERGFWRFKRPRRVGAISWDCYQEERRRELLRRHGYAP